MPSLTPVAFYGLEVPCGDEIIPAVPDFPATFRITMAAIDPSAPIDTEASEGSTVARATLKLIRQPIGPLEDEDEDSEEDDDDEYMRALLSGPDSEEDDSEEDEEAGPSDPAKSKKARKQAALEELLASIDKDDSDEDMEDEPKKLKGKSKAALEDDDEEDSDEDDEEDMEIEEFVICTLDAEKNFQQTIDITIGEDERVFFKVTGTHSIHLTGNYLIADDDGHNHHHNVYDSEEDDEEDDEDYDLSPDEDELLDDDEESDELDTLEDPRILELEDDEVPELVTKADKKGKNKRAAEEPAETLDEIMEKTGTNGDAKLSKKQQKKLKNNKGEAIASEAAASDKDAKKVQFAKNLEQGPTGSEAPKPAAGKAALGVRTVKGVKVDDKKIGSGPAAKKGDRVGMRYIGKLTDGKVFDANKKGKPFSFKLGAGEVIQGWDFGIAGMQVGGERRLTVPANLAYGSKSLPGIPANSTLVFDVKMLEIK
ncbi:hypothetical protein V495_08715 [Pseudogymnoascus sp. VKM F-4514 (FW-929)]|nr:hypothetical protein V495_08715 [Pseudogymnoascus sp. VKM F-4514 (FW-929)]KFY55611.1 hypothetical protein V497_06850 [Pseudogymnoascus sp. VKM F-4516 (FW-969)]